MSPIGVNRLCRLAAVCAALAAAAPAAGAPSEDESLFTPPAVYEAQSRRDPFVQPAAGMLHNVMTRVDIDALKLTGIISHPRRTMALFTSQSGPRFGYLLKDGKLYGENHRLIAGITGQVIDRDRALLKQGAKRIVFKLR